MIFLFKIDEILVIYLIFSIGSMARLHMFQYFSSHLNYYETYVHLIRFVPLEQENNHNQYRYLWICCLIIKIFRRIECIDIVENLSTSLTNQIFMYELFTMCMLKYTRDKTYWHQFTLKWNLFRHSNSINENDEF